MPASRIEPRTKACQADVLTTYLLRLSCTSQITNVASRNASSGQDLPVGNSHNASVLLKCEQGHSKFIVQYIAYG